jgi:D-alanine-D-alanine ligase
MGGPSAEREVSLRSGAAVARGLKAAGYRVAEIDIRNHGLPAIPRDVDAVFVALHGEFGEDGQIQRVVEQAGIPYTGSSPDASRIAFDKRLSKQRLEAAGIPTPPYEVLAEPRDRTLRLPVVVKPPCQGSTIGAHRVFRLAQWHWAFGDAKRYGDAVLVESYIAGRELTVGVIGREGEALPVVEVIAPNGWYDYRAKYTPGLTRYVVPARLDNRVAQRCQRLALAAFRALGCRGLARVDFRMSRRGELFVLELNSIPGFTETSLLPKAAGAAGLGFPDLCDRIVRAAL